MSTGKFIAIHGINGIGKTTQAELLVEFLKSKGLQASRLKYPVYDLEPEGPFIHEYLRDPEFRAANQLTAGELQSKYAKNRERYEPELKQRLETGEWIIAEDYVGTGIAWGLAWGWDLESLENERARVLMPHLSLLLYGQRFQTAIETSHLNESNEERIRICSNFFLLLADRYSWEKVNANQSVEAVQAEIMHILISEGII